MLPESGSFRQTIAQHPGGGQYTAVSGVDGLERRINVQRLGELPLYITSSLEVSSIKAEWFGWITTQLIFGIPVTCLLLFLAVFGVSGSSQDG